MTTRRPTIAKSASYKDAFLQACLSSSVLRFGSFTLKSGRLSPYFFNAGLFHRASVLRSASTAYAQSILAYLDHLASSDGPPLDFDVLFGPAYKGIPLATATVDRLADIDPQRFGNISYSFNRKEAKNHGEGGNIVGAQLNGQKVLIIDDVITAGTAIREAIEIIEKEGGILVGIIVALNRMEKMPPKEGQADDEPRGSAIGEVSKEFNIPVLSILTLDDLIGGLQGIGSEDDIRRMEEYRAKYLASD